MKNQDVVLWFCLIPIAVSLALFVLGAIAERIGMYKAFKK